MQRSSLRRSSRSVFLFLVLSWSPAASNAHEGMWLPTLLQSIESDLKTAGLRISADDIYSVNHGSIKDAVVLFGGGCTAEVVSSQGLIFTNHHCGFSAIQEHSSLEHDYLKDGFWATTRQDELKNDGLTATFIIRMEDVTDRIMAGLTVGLSETDRREVVARQGEAIAKEAMNGTHYRAVVRPFNYGNSYYLVVTETFLDVRLVGAPPGAVGKFGGDTDNWMWPRHTGDFSVFRIYAGADNKPASPSDSNVPFVPRHVLPVSLDGVKEGDFAMIFGFPGNTQRYLSSYGVEYIMNTQDPLRIRMRDASLGVIDQAMRSDDLTRIRYAGKQSSISNGWKKWIGELRGLNELNALEAKRTFEADYRQRASASPEFGQVLDSLRATYDAWTRYAKARDLFVEFVAVGPELLRFAYAFKGLLEDQDTLRRQGKLEGELQRLKAACAGHFKDYDAGVDKRIFKAQLPIYRAEVDPELAPSVLQEIVRRYKGSTDAYTDALYARSMFASEKALSDALSKFSPKVARQMATDPAFMAAKSFYAGFLERIRPRHAVLSDRIEVEMRTYVQGMMALFPERTWWPDANSTLRLSYGRVEGSDPRDGVTYKPFTTLEGILEKYKPGDAEFDVPARLIELYENKDYGRYGENGHMPVCFTSSLHTTGGNSGSPVLNGRGELIGLNFDRTWESTMSDILFDPAKCRNISVDVRYVLFIIDKLCGAGHLIDEMQLASHPSNP